MADDEETPVASEGAEGGNEQTTDEATAGEAEESEVEAQETVRLRDGDMDRQTDR